MTKLMALLNDYPATAECSCRECQLMCHEPCWPLPHQAMILLRKGYGDAMKVHRHMACTVLVPVRKGGQLPCVFQDEEKLCELHDKGLKPFEGKVIDHAKPHDEKHSDELRDRIAGMWDTMSGELVIRWWAKHYGSEEDRKKYGEIPAERGGHEETAVAEVPDTRS
jgi:hypothetical protein